MLNIYEVELAKRSLLNFTMATMPRFSPTWFHKSYYEVLSKFACGEIKHLMVFVPPQHGKSEGSTRRLPAYMLGVNPDLKFGIVSYSAPKARKFNREIQRVIDTPEYQAIFPGTALNFMNLATVAGGWLRNADECEIVGKRGGFKTVGVGGPLTGEPVDMLILDDIYKDAKSAWSETVRDGIEDWFNTVADSRLHNDSQVLIVFTRWHEHDLAGYLLEQEGRIEDGGKWHVVTYPALKLGDPTEVDPRHEGDALWPERHSVEKLTAVKNRDGHVFESLYQQNPKPIKGLLYKVFRTYKDLPLDADRRKAVVDTADEGSDFLCSIVYAPTKTGYYLLDVYYTQEGMEVTEEMTAAQIKRFNVQHCTVESNNGGRGFARNVERICRTQSNTRTSFKWYHQSDNKQTRIFTNSADVQNMMYYPEDWEYRWPEFARHVKNYMAEGKNKHDDAEDALTMIIEAEGKKDNQPYEITPGGKQEADLARIKRMYGM
jgi:predicted phage terminase large subunit-like protein